MSYNNVRLYSSQIPIFDVGGDLLDAIKFLKKFDAFRRQSPDLVTRLRQCLSADLTELLERRAGLSNDGTGPGIVLCGAASAASVPVPVDGVVPSSTVDDDSEDGLSATTVPLYDDWTEEYLRKRLLAAFTRLRRSAIPFACGR